MFCNPGGEDARLAALYRYDLLDTPQEERFDRITRIVKAAMGTPMATVSLIDKERQWFKSRQGLRTVETPRDISFCTHTIEQDRPLIVADALQDARFAESPLVTGEPHVRFYIGAPLRNRDGQNIGALCAMDVRPRAIDDSQIRMMEDLSRLVVDEIEMRMVIATDVLTDTMSRRYFFQQAQRDVVRTSRFGGALSCAMLDIDHFKTINDTYGHNAGDAVLREVAAVCKAALRDADYVGRYGGEEFAIMLRHRSPGEAYSAAEQLREALATAQIVVAGCPIALTASIGVASFNAEDDTESLLKKADLALYAAKQQGRNRTVEYAAPVYRAA